MACSKVFSGDLPELTNEIIQYFKKDISTLYSCILVNRLWCRLTIPLLWEDPFLVPNKHHRCIIEIYLRFLNEDDKAKFNEYDEYGINDKLLPSNDTLFNYPSFIKCLDVDIFCYSIRCWVNTLLKYNNKNYKLGNLVYRSLFGVFIKNEGKLHFFEVVLFDYHEYFNDNLDLILQNPNLLYNIRNLKLSIDNAKLPQNLISFLTFLYSNCNSISSIVFNFPQNDYSLIEKYLLQIIISQRNLKKISFEHDTTALYNPFLSLKNSNCSNTLNTIIFYFIDFKSIVSILQEVFDQLNVLESIHLIYCRSLNSDFVQQIIKVIKPFKLRSLFMNEFLHIESLQLLLQKVSDWLENFGLIGKDDEPKQQLKQLFRLIMKYCTKIKYYDLGMLVPNDIIYPFIENNQHNINYLTIIYYDDYFGLGSTVLQNLGQILPSKLEYLCLSFSFSTSDLEIFLKNSQNTFIKKLLIRYYISKGKDENILFYLKKYIMKKERVKYLAIAHYNDINNELFYLKDEVNEFKSHNIMVQKFSDLCIDGYSFVNKHFQLK